MSSGWPCHLATLVMRLKSCQIVRARTIGDMGMTSLRYKLIQTLLRATNFRDSMLKDLKRGFVECKEAE